MTVEGDESVDILLSSTDIAVIGIDRVIITILDDDREFLNILYGITFLIIISSLYRYHCWV